jgi:tRNA(Ile)-lysidine synthase TilS/MesJ
MLFRMLRKRGITPQQFTGDGNMNEYERGVFRDRISKLHTEIEKLDQTIKERDRTITNQALLIHSLDEERMQRITSPPSLAVTPSSLPKKTMSLLSTGCSR